MLAPRRVKALILAGDAVYLTDATAVPGGRSGAAAYVALLPDRQLPVVVGDVGSVTLYVRDRWRWRRESALVVVAHGPAGLAGPAGEIRRSAEEAYEPRAAPSLVMRVARLAAAGLAALPVAVDIAMELRRGAGTALLARVLPWLIIGGILAAAILAVLGGHAPAPAPAGR